MKKENDLNQPSAAINEEHEADSKPGMSRRRFVVATLAAASVLPLSKLALFSEAAAKALPVRELLPLGPTLTQPEVVRSAGKTVQMNLNVVGKMVRFIDPASINVTDPDPKSVTYRTGLFRTYNGSFPGPTLDANIGDRVIVNLTNNVNPKDFPPTDDSTDTDHPKCDVHENWYPGEDKSPACFHGDNVTNVHYHGTHVTPDNHGDNVLVSIGPKGGKFTNDFVITSPEGHVMGQAPGTHWYHPHKHGSVAVQILNGMSGAFIIRGPYDEELERAIPGLRKTEKILVLQQVNDVVNLWLENRAAQRKPGQRAPIAPPLIVNGQYQPTITMQPGEIQLWRLVNATGEQGAHKVFTFYEGKIYLPALLKAQQATRKLGRLIPLQLPLRVAANTPNIEFRTTAFDGIQLKYDNYEKLTGTQSFEMAPGNRTDILVKAPTKPGVYYLDMTDRITPAKAQQLGVRNQENYLLAVRVLGPRKPMNWPTKDNYPKFPDWLGDIDSVQHERTLRFNAEGTAGGAHNTAASGQPRNPPHLMIDGKQFDPDRVDQRITLGYSEEWTVINETTFAMHPFHIHINPFQVREIFDPTPLNPVTPKGATYPVTPPDPPTILSPPYIWRDTLALPPAYTWQAEGATQPTTVNGYIKMRSRFVDFPGKFVLHCHILGHEDRGMMQLVQVVKS